MPWLTLNGKRIEIRKHNMKVLALDTSNRPLSVAVLDGEKILDTITTTTRWQHEKDLLPLIDQLMKTADFKPADLDAVVIAYGPGSYTGVRIACTTAKVLAFTLGIKLIPVSSLATLALNARGLEGAYINPIFDARNDNMYTGLYRIKDHEPVRVIKDQHVSLTDWLKQIKAIQHPILGLGDAINFKKQLTKAISDYHFITGSMNLPQAAELGLFGESQKPVDNINHFVPN